MGEPMDLAAAYAWLSPTTLADVLPRDRVMDPGIHPLWPGMPRLAGPAFTARCAAGDNLMAHAAIHRAPPGAVIVVEAGDHEWAIAGGNVMRWAQARGVAGFVIDGMIRDIAEARDAGVRVFARGVIPKPAGKGGEGTLGEPVRCGGVLVAPGDIVVADEEGVVVVPAARAEDVLAEAEAKAARDADESLEDWAEKHAHAVDDVLRKRGLPV